MDGNQPKKTASEIKIEILEEIDKEIKSYEGIKFTDGASRAYICDGAITALKDLRKKVDSM